MNTKTLRRSLGVFRDHDSADVPVGDWVTTSEATGQVTVASLDQPGRQIRGTFRFVARNSAGELLTVSEGTFSGHYFVDP